MFGDYWIEMAVDDYTTSYDSETCGFLIGYSPIYNIIGTKVISNYYVVFDRDNM